MNAECDELRIEHAVSAVAKKRPVFDALLAELQEGDTFVVWALDRAFRSTLDALIVAKELRERGVHLHIVTLCVDTSTSAGRFVYALLAALAEFERDTLIERTCEGLRAARRRGKVLGRPRKLSEADLQLARELLAGDQTQTIKGVAASFGCSRKTLSRALQTTPPC